MGRSYIRSEDGEEMIETEPHQFVCRSYLGQQAHRHLKRRQRQRQRQKRKAEDAQDRK